MSGHRKKPNEIIALRQFVTDVTAMQETLLGYANDLRASSPHYTAVCQAQEALSATLETVMGERAVLIGHGQSGPYSVREYYLRRLAGG